MPIVEAVGIAAGAMSQDRKDLVRQIEDAMADSVAHAQAQGVTDPDEIRVRMLAARDAVKRQSLSMAARMEAVMVATIEQAQAEGVDADEIGRRLTAVKEGRG